MKFKKTYAIAACDPKGILGNLGTLPWNCKEDLEHFSKTTYKNIIVMGFQTYCNIPKFYFNHRLGIIFSKQHQKKNQKNIIFVNSLHQFLSLTSLPVDTTIYIAGGAQIYALFLKENLIQKVILTKLKHCYKGDTVFPLSLIYNWPYKKIHDHHLFCIYNYFNPRFKLANKNY